MAQNCNIKGCDIRPYRKKEEKEMKTEAIVSALLFAIGSVEKDPELNKLTKQFIVGVLRSIMQAKVSIRDNAKIRYIKRNH